MSDNKIDDTLNKGLKSAKNALSDTMISLANKDSAKSQQQMAFNVIFTGQFTKDEKLVIAAMAKFFKQGQEATKRLLKPGRVIKSFPDKGPADKLAKMLSNIGLNCKVEMEAEEEERSAASSMLEKAAFKIADTNAPNVHVPKLSELNKTTKIIAAAVAGLIVVVVIWLSLQPPVVEGDSFDSYEASVQKVLDKASVEIRPDLEIALKRLTEDAKRIYGRDSFTGSEKVASGVVYSRVNGLTAEEIITVAKDDMERQRKLYRDEIQNVKDEITALEEEIKELSKSNGIFEKISLSDLRFAWKADADAPEMSLRVTNNSNEVLSRVFFQGYLRDSEGKLLVTAPFAYGTAIGMQPGSIKFFTLTPNKESPWSTMDAKLNWKTALFTATVENVVNISGRELGIDVRPQEKSIEDKKAHIKRLEKELDSIKF